MTKNNVDTIYNFNTIENISKTPVSEYFMIGIKSGFTYKLYPRFNMEFNETILNPGNNL